MFDLQPQAIPDVKLIHPKIHRDERGYVCEVMQEKRLADQGLNLKFVQENQSLSLKRSTVRGLHFQRSPKAQAKLIRVLRGKVFDVAVDVRPQSPSFGQYVGVELSDAEPVQFFIPAGFAHGFCTLTDDTVILYKMSEYYAPDSETGILWNDPALNIAWPIQPEAAILSGKDRQLPLLKDLAPLSW